MTALYSGEQHFLAQQVIIQALIEQWPDCPIDQIPPCAVERLETVPELTYPGRKYKVTFHLLKAEDPAKKHVAVVVGLPFLRMLELVSVYRQALACDSEAQSQSQTQEEEEGEEETDKQEHRDPSPHGVNDNEK